MILIAESGSTKCDAVFLDNTGKELSRFRMMGFNPYFHSVEFISEQALLVEEIAKYRIETTHIFFYGAGCSSPGLNKIISTGLEPVFPNAEILVDHDLKACAYSTYIGDPSINCILGTGSNSVYFDGSNVSEEVPSLAFILGDEGSASFIGKKLISSFLYKKMPKDLADDFFNTYGLTKDAVIDRVYAKPNANVFLGSLAPFAHKHINKPFIYNIVSDGFRQFIEIHVLCFPQAKNVSVNFVGSVAYHFQVVLEELMNDMGLKMGQIIRRPLDGLINYHLTQLPNSKQLFNLDEVL